MEIVSIMQVGLMPSQRSLKVEKENRKEAVRDLTMEEQSERCNSSGFENGRRGSWTKKCGKPPEGGKG